MGRLICQRCLICSTTMFLRVPFMRLNVFSDHLRLCPIPELMYTFHYALAISSCPSWLLFESNIGGVMVITRPSSLPLWRWKPSLLGVLQWDYTQYSGKSAVFSEYM